MNQQPSRVESLWRRFAGMFGADTLARKFGDSPTPEWTSLVNQLKDFELERGMRRLIRSGKSYVPAVPEFARMCREIGGDDNADENRRPLLPPPNIPGMDSWEMAANRHLLAYILRQQNLYRRGFNADETMLLVEGKKAWAVDMREAHESDTKPADHGKDIFNQYMEAAIVQMGEKKHVPASYAGGVLA
jgi:hypothetical protein